MDEFELELRSLTCISLYGDELENVFDDALTTKPNTTKLNIFQNSYKKCVLRPDRILQLTMVVILRENFQYSSLIGQSTFARVICIAKFLRKCAEWKKNGSKYIDVSFVFSRLNTDILKRQGILSAAIYRVEVVTRVALGLRRKLTIGNILFQR